ncbi:MAG: hypothetical protein ACLPQS_10730 [Acidimicrobiales bacterium]
MELDEIVAAFARGIQSADALRPQAANSRTGAPYQAGIGPHTESDTISLAVNASGCERLASAAREVPYPKSPRSRCDLVVDGGEQWAIEVKMLRLLGDNGKPNDNILMHILSPYPAHRSAVADCKKLLNSGLVGRKAILIFGYDYQGWPMDPAVDAFELLAASQVVLRRATPAHFSGLVHPVHDRGRVFGWAIQ